MANIQDITVNFVGPGSQPPEPDGAAMEFMQLPDDMSTYQMPMVPEAEDTALVQRAIGLARDLATMLHEHQCGSMADQMSLDDLTADESRFFDQLLGEGEVSVMCQREMNARIQESVLAGVWRVQYLDNQQQIIRDTVEVGAMIRLATESVFDNAAEQLRPAELDIPPTAYNAAPLLTEIADKLEAASVTDAPPHVINLSLLPHTQEDIETLSNVLGIGPLVILSRGYGSCRISATATRNVWWVQYFNSQDTLILNTLEISRIPAVACASAEDIKDSAERLDEILSIYEAD